MERDRQTNKHIVIDRDSKITYLRLAPSWRAYLAPIPKLVVEVAELQPRLTPVSTPGDTCTIFIIVTCVQKIVYMCTKNGVHVYRKLYTCVQKILYMCKENCVHVYRENL